MTAADNLSTTPSLKPSFTALANCFFETYLKELSHPQLVVILVIYRKTSGWLTTEAKIPQEVLIRETGLPRSTVYAALKVLKELGAVKVKRGSRKECCYYSLNPELQPVMTAEEKALKALEVTKKKEEEVFDFLIQNSMLIPGGENFKSFLEEAKNSYFGLNVAPENKKKKKEKTLKEKIEVEKKNEDLANSLKAINVSPAMAEKLAREVDRQVIIKALSNPNLANADNKAAYVVAEITCGGYTSKKKAPRVRGPLHPLAKRLQEQGVSKFLARRLVEVADHQVITKALERLKQLRVPPNNPAGYLVAEIKRGGYSQTPCDKDKPIRLKNQQLQEAQKAEKLAKQQQAEQRAAQDLAVLDYFAQLPPEQQAPLLAQVDAQLPNQRLKERWNLQHPAYCAFLIEVLKSQTPDLYKDMLAMNVQQHPSDDSQPKSQEGCDEILAIFKKLTDYGVDPQVARNLAKQCSLDVVERAIKRLTVVCPDRPVAYLVAEIKRGGYSSLPRAKEDKAKLEREKFEKLLQEEREREKRQKELRASESKLLLDKFENLPPLQKEALMALFEPTTKPFSHLRDWGPNHPAYQGFFIEFLQKMFLNKAS